jgi:ribosomal protein S18 acetylase RimI-like enzyme
MSAAGAADLVHAAGAADLVVRPARPDEYDEAGRVCAAGYHADDSLRLADGTIDRQYEALLLDAARRAREGELLVAVHPDGRIAGTVTWCPPGSPWRDLAGRPDQAEFRMLSVAGTERRQGVGRALVQACLDRARAAGMTEVVLATLPSMGSAQRLYREFGFERAPELDFQPTPHVSLWGFRLDLAVPDPAQ